MSYEEKARAYFLEGYTCAQSVLLAFSDKTGLDEKTALRIASSFGGGLGRLREVCGAVSGMAMVAGLLYGFDQPHPGAEKASHYARIQKMAGAFRDQYGSILCRELLSLDAGPSSPIPEARTPDYYKRRKTCVDCIGTAAAITEKLIEKNGEL